MAGLAGPGWVDIGPHPGGVSCCIRQRDQKRHR